MANLWLKIRIWTKIVAFALLTLYVLIFLTKNSGHEVQFWFWFGPQQQHSLLLVVFIAFMVGVLGTILVRTTFKTIRQVKEMRARSRTEKLEREMQEMRTKAAMLQTRPQTEPAE